MGSKARALMKKDERENYEDYVAMGEVQLEPEGEDPAKKLPESDEE